MCLPCCGNTRLRPDKSLGQNFLVDESALHKVMAAAEVASDEDVLEIGPGLGSLTRHLATAARSVVAVELDARLMPPLQEVLSACTNVSLVQGDILLLNPAQLVNRPDSRPLARVPGRCQHPLLHHIRLAPPPAGSREASPAA